MLKGIVTIIMILLLAVVFGFMIWSKKTRILSRWFSLLMTRFIIASLGIYLLNSFASLIDFHLPINPVTIFITGILGIPGLLSLIFIKVFLI